MVGSGHTSHLSPWSPLITLSTRSKKLVTGSSLPICTKLDTHFVFAGSESIEVLGCVNNHLLDVLKGSTGAPSVKMITFNLGWVPRCLALGGVKSSMNSSRCLFRRW